MLRFVRFMLVIVLLATPIVALGEIGRAHV